MNVLLCYSYIVGNVGSCGLFDILLKEMFPDTLRFETNFEQVLGLAKAGEVEKVIVWGAGYNWSKATSDANLIMADDAVSEIHNANPDVRVMAIGLHEDYVAPAGVIKVPRFQDKLLTAREVVEFLESTGDSVFPLSDPVSGSDSF